LFQSFFNISFYYFIYSFNFHFITSLTGFAISYNVPGICEVPNEVRDLSEGFSPNRIHSTLFSKWLNIHISCFSETSFRILIPYLPISAWNYTKCFHVSNSTTPFSILTFPLVQNSLASHLLKSEQYPVVLSRFVQPYLDRCQRGSSTSNAIISLFLMLSPFTLSTKLFLYIQTLHLIYL